MRNKFLVLAFCGISLACCGQNPDDYRWKNRLILLFAPTDSEANFQQQLGILTQEQAEVTDRDLLIFKIHPTKEDELKLYDQYGVGKDQFCLLLIGKDGGVKLRSGQPVQFAKIAGLIDSMPMRRAEMRQRDRKSGR